MAKEDFCFTYYDGDAARDKAHMTRLERGGYDDIISAQRKFGHLSIDIIRRVLGSDFAACWPNIEIVMKKDEEGKFYLEWVENSVNQMRKSSQKQKEKIAQYWDDVKTGKKPRNKKNHSPDIPQYKKNNTTDIPLEDGIGIEDEFVFKEGGSGEETLSGPGEGFFLCTLSRETKLTDLQIGATVEFILYSCEKTIKPDEVEVKWTAFKILNFSKREWYNSFEHLLSHFRNSIKNDILKNGNQYAKTKQNHPYQPAITGAASGAGKL